MLPRSNGVTSAHYGLSFIQSKAEAKPQLATLGIKPLILQRPLCPRRHRPLRLAVTPTLGRVVAWRPGPLILALFSAQPQPLRRVEVIARRVPCHIEHVARLGIGIHRVEITVAQGQEMRPGRAGFLAESGPAVFGLVLKAQPDRLDLAINIGAHLFGRNLALLALPFGAPFFLEPFKLGLADRIQPLGPPPAAKRSGARLRRMNISSRSL